MGGAAVDASPEWLKSFAIRTFGEQDKMALLIGIGVVLTIAYCAGLGLPFVLIGSRKESVETLSMVAFDEASSLRFGPAAAYATILFVYVAVTALVFVRLLGADVIGGRLTELNVTSPTGIQQIARINRENVPRIVIEWLAKKVEAGADQIIVAPIFPRENFMFGDIRIVWLGRDRSELEELAPVDAYDG